MSALGSLVVKLALEYAQYTQGLNKADQEALKFAQNAQKHFDMVTSAVGGFVGGVVTGAASAAAAYLTIGSAIDQVNQSIQRMDAIENLSQRLGIARDKLQEFSYMAKMSDSSLDGLATGAKKLSVLMAEAAGGSEEAQKKFKGIGVSATDSNGKLRDSGEVMADIADKFEGMKNGAGKTALAIELFGKSGADLIPMLNGGGKAMREAAEEARKFGLVVSDEAIIAAADFGDNLDRLGSIVEGTFNQLSEAALPTLNALTGAMIDSLTSTDSLNQAAQNLNKDGSIASWAEGAGRFLAFVMDGAMGVSRLFEGIGKTIGAAAAQVAAILSGDLAGAKAIGEAWSKDMEDLLDRELFSSRFEAKLAEVKKTLAEKAEQVKNGRNGGDNDAPNISGGSAAKAAKEQLSDFQKLTIAINERIAAISAEDASVTKLTESEKFATKTLVELRDGKLKLTTAERQALAVRMEEMILTDRRAESRKEQERIDAETLASREKDIVAIQAQIDKTNEETAAFQKLPSEITATTIAKLEGRKAALELAGAYDYEIQHVEALILKNKELRDSQERKQVQAATKKEADEAAKEYQKAADKIEQSLTDALMRGFESGKSIAENFRDTLINMFKTTILRPTIQGLMMPIAGTLASGASAATGGGGSAAGGAGSLLSSGASAAGLFGSGGLAGAVMGGAGWVTGATTFTGALSAGASLIGTGTAAGFASGLGMIAGALGPIALGVGAIMAIVSALDDSGTIHTGGAGSYSASSGASTVDARGLGFMRIDTTEAANDASTSIAKNIVAVLDGTAKSFGKQVGYSAATAFADDTSKDGAWGALKIALNGNTVLDWDSDRQSRWAPREYGDGEEGRKAYLKDLGSSIMGALDAMDLPAWAQSMLDAIGDTPAIENIASVVEQINGTQSAIEMLGELFTEFADVSDESIALLIKSVGGAQNLLGSLSSFANNYLTDAERLVPVSNKVSGVYAGLGMSGDTTREQFTQSVRDAMKDPSESGKERLRQLLSIEGYADQLFDFWEAGSKDAAAQAKKNADDAIAKARATSSKEAQWLRLSGNAAEATKIERNLEIDAMEASLRPIQERINKLQDAKDAEALAIENLDKSRDNLLSAYDRESGVLEQTADKFDGFAKSLKVFKAQLLIGNLTTLSPEQRYQAAKENFQSVAARAKQGDEEAMAELQGASQDFLEISREYYASSEQYVADFALVQAAIGNAADSAEDQAQTARDQLTEMRNQLAALGVLNTSVLSVKDAVGQYLTALNSKAAASQGVINAGGTVAGGSPASAINSIVENLYATLAGKTGSQIDDEGRSFWAGQLATKSYAEVEQTFSNSVTDYNRLHGSNYGGIDSVPFDGFVSELHRGEEVVSVANKQRQALALAQLNKTMTEVKTELQAANSQRSAVAQLEAGKLDDVKTKLDTVSRQLAKVGA
ncbi:hypothetical protein ACFQUU_08795 [Herbaspirillum sp. GCM10030257]|uniref:hypothetical protein n=1 Tax=Herbaspirillum sp. GCM10030257 TaxID=3273393 RepID=UPI0036102C32